jgi:hypothetical protein
MTSIEHHFILVFQKEPKPLITITRSLARQLRTVFRRVLNITPKCAAYSIVLDTGSSGSKAISGRGKASVLMPY